MIYFIGSNSEKKVKIGYTSSKIRQRFLTVQTNCPFDVEVLLTIEGMMKTEEYIHQLFKKHHIRGEWFELSPEIEQFLNNPTVVHIKEEFKPVIRIKDGNDEQIDKLYSENISMKEIAEQTGYSFEQIRRYCYTRKLHTKYERKWVNCGKGNKGTMIHFIAEVIIPTYRI